MDVKEAERVVVAKPVASRPTCPPFRSFSELLAGAINASPSIESSQATVSAIRPKTVRFKPAMNRPPPAGFISSEDNPSYKSCNKPDTNQTIVYKPTAKLVSKATVSLLANMGNYSTSHSQQFQHRNQEKPRSNLSSINLQNNNTPHAESNHLAIECFKMVQQSPEEDQKTSPSTSNGGDRPCYDGYNWRKYGQKQVKGSEYPRSYYKCTHPNCPVKKKVERSFDGMIAEIVYKGEHNHSKPQPPKRNSTGTQGSGMVSDGLGQDTSCNNHLWGNPNLNEKNENRIENQRDAGYVVKAVGSPENSYAQSEECEEGGSKVNEVEEDEPKSKRRKNENQTNEVAAAAAAEEGLVEPQVVVQSSTDCEVLGDGFRWRKYGQKVVKGNPYPRSYYRCTNIKCSARKHLERSIDDPKAFITTYEGKHNHEMPRKTIGAVASEKLKP